MRQSGQAAARIRQDQPERQGLVLQSPGADWVNDKQGCGVVAFNWYWCDDNSMSGDWRREVNSGQLTEWGRIFRDDYLRRVNPPK
jgi:hypothetical protein